MSEARLDSASSSMDEADAEEGAGVCIVPVSAESKSEER